MSDDTPTERFSTPTQPLAVTDEPKSRALLYALIAVGAALVIAIIVVLVIFFSRPTKDDATTPPSSTPTTSPTPSATPTPTPTPTATTPSPTASAPAAPPATGPIESFTIDEATVPCGNNATSPMHFSWSATGATLYFGVGTDNAKFAPYDEYPLTYELDFDYQCGQPGGQQKYTITVEQANHDLTSQTIVVTEVDG